MDIEKISPVTHIQKVSHTLRIQQLRDDENIVSKSIETELLKDEQKCRIMVKIIAWYGIPAIYIIFSVVYFSVYLIM